MCKCLSEMEELCEQKLGTEQMQKNATVEVDKVDSGFVNKALSIGNGGG